MTSGLEQLLVALDVDTAADALALADRLRGVAGGFKVGNRLFTSHGPAFVSDLVSRFTANRVPIGEQFVSPRLQRCEFLT